jgi:hypothetical protein
MKANRERTRAYYQALEPEGLCDCAYCKHYYAQVKAAYPAVADYLAGLGVDVERPFEIDLPAEEESGDMVYHVCQYVVFGSCSDSYQHRISDVSLRRAEAYPTTGIEEAHFMLELYPIRLQGMLPE